MITSLPSNQERLQHLTCLNLHEAINVENKNKKTESFPFIVGETFITMEVWKSPEFTAGNQIFLLTDRRKKERKSGVGTKGGREEEKKRKEGRNKSVFWDGSKL